MQGNKVEVCKGCGEDFERVLGFPGYCPGCREARETAWQEEERAEYVLRQAETRIRWGEECGRPWKFRGTSFLNWAPRAGNITRAFESCRAYAEEFPLEDAHGFRSLGLYSRTNGLGKTHLVAAMVNRIIERWEGPPEEVCPVRFETGPSLIMRIRGTYNIRSGDQGHETEEEVYRDLNRVPLLIVDDAGKEAPSDHTRRVYFSLIDGRYSAGLPLVLVSNLRGVELESLIGAAAADRLAEMCNGPALTLSGKSYRQLMLGRDG